MLRIRFRDSGRRHAVLADGLATIYERQTLKLHERSVTCPSKLQIVQSDPLDRLAYASSHAVCHGRPLHCTCSDEGARDMYRSNASLLDTHDSRAESSAITDSLYSQLEQFGWIRAVQEVCCECVDGEVWGHGLVCCIGGETHN